jgi:rhodanese-related sulfurtransferase
MPTSTDALIGTPTAKRLIEEEGAVLVDVRTPGEYATEHLPGSLNLPIDRLRRDRTNALGFASGPVVLVCASGDRAAQAHGLLAEHADVPVRVLDGGLGAWKEAGEPTERGTRNMWGMERQVRLTAGSLVVVFVASSLAWDLLKWPAAAIGAGLVVAAVTDTCAMAKALTLFPWNRAKTSAS